MTINQIREALSPYAGDKLEQHAASFSTLFATRKYQPDVAFLDCYAAALRLGLSPNPDTGHVYYVPRSGQVTLMVGYKGYTHLAHQAGVYPQHGIVYAGDTFEVDLADTAKPITHKPVLDPAKRGNMVAAYALATMQNGVVLSEVMLSVDIEAIKRRTRANTGPWATDPGEMARKTVLRRLAKRLPLGEELWAQVAREEKQEAVYAKPEPEQLDEATIELLGKLAQCNSREDLEMLYETLDKDQQTKNVRYFTQRNQAIKKGVTS